MYPKINRLSKKKDFDRVWQEKKSAYICFLGIKKAENGLDINRFGVIVSMKISKKAVERNRIKRKIRAVICDEAQKLKNGFDIIVIALPKIINVDKETVKEEIIRLFQKVKLYQ